MIFWGYLIRAIRNPNNACAPTPRPWLQAPCFKFWTAVSVITGLLLFGATSIETTDLDAQRVYPFPSISRDVLIDSHTSSSLLLESPYCKSIRPEVFCTNDSLSFGSFALAFYLPGFINRMKDFGAGFEMQERLAVFQEINFMRTLARVTYSICFVCHLFLPCQP